MTDLDTVLKRGDITLPTKLCIAKATAFPVIKHKPETWTIKKAECQIIGAGEDSRESLELQIKPVNPKRSQL